MSLSNMFSVVLSCWLCFCFWTCSAETDDVEQLILRQKAFETWMMQDVAYVNKQLNKLEEEFKILSRSMQQSLPQNETSTHTNDQLSQTSIRLTKAFSDNKKAVAERISGISTHVSELEKQLRESVEETEESILTTIAATVQEAQQEWSEKLEERISGVQLELQNGTSTIGKELLVDRNILTKTVARIDDLNNSLANVITKLNDVWMQLNPTKLEHFIRLVGPKTNMGRVEIFCKGQWGTVCNDKFDTNNNGANVVCKMLGFSAGEVAMAFGSGSGPIWLDDVTCSGSEDNIRRCKRRDPIGMHNCYHSEDVGVVCR